MKELVLEIKYGGLGDHLFYSHLPRIAKETGVYQRVYVSNYSIFSNLAFKNLVWERNPYLDGFIDKPGHYPIFEDTRPGCNLLDEIMLRQGLDDGKRYHEAEVYYEPRLIPQLQNKTLYVPNYISHAGYLTGPMIERYFRDHNIHIDYQGWIREKTAVPILNFDSFLKTPSFWDFIDVIFSVKELYCLVTGQATLLPALGKKAVVFYTKDQKPMFRHSKINNYIELPEKS
jgi:hypothetical protein